MVRQIQTIIETSHIYAHQIENPNDADPKITAIADAMKALASYIDEIMNELKEVILSSSPITSPKAN